MLCYWSAAERKRSEQKPAAERSCCSWRDLWAFRLKVRLWDPHRPPPCTLHIHVHDDTHEHTHTHTHAFSVIAVLQWSVEEVVIASLQPLTSWSRLSVRRTLPSQSIYRQISKQMMQIWNNGLILDADRRRSPQNADDDVDWRDAPELNTIFCTNCLFSAHLFSVITSARREVHSLFVA